MGLSGCKKKAWADEKEVPMKHLPDVPSTPTHPKGFAPALDRFLNEVCPSLRGELIREPVVKEICAMIDRFFPPTERMRMGQVLWYAVAADQRAGMGKRIQDCKLQPVIVDVTNASDVEDILNALPRRERNKKVIVRLFEQAYEQGGVFSCADVASIMRLSPSTVSIYARQHEEETGQVVPRRGNIHDLGPTVTHKRIICRKHLKEGLSIEQTARETHHSPKSVVRYVNDFKRIRECLKAGWTVEKAAYTTGLSIHLAAQYFEMMTTEELPF
ncbi:MAG: DUF1670 domain-containing protein [Chitinivibrionales bacterium]|nr:DUF1670 domain-containing protein [Chitinivibrionales bacterium]